jgi:N6-L-threonylcarbamoyladenine synthase
MKILSVETSCDETAVSLIEAKGGLTEPFFKVLGNALFSQIEIHKKYGGVFPVLAKREHSKNLVPLLTDTLTQASEYQKTDNKISNEVWQKITKILERENELATELQKNFDDIKRPDIDFIAVTAGPGLEPALWVGISFAKALGLLWNLPVLPINHMEGHIASVLLGKSDTDSKNNIQFPALALLISGGHTELVEISDWGKYKIIGKTLDDAVGEAFDKVARMLALPYPGGPEISRLAELARTENLLKKCKLPRPMIHSGDFNFSFSGLKTAVLYYIRDHSAISEEDKPDIAREFEDATVEVLLNKTEKAIIQTGAKTLIVAGGVISNKKLRAEFEKLSEKYNDLDVRIPLREMATDNSLMIAIAAFVDVTKNPETLKEQKEIKANGNLELSEKL